jgi:hypothetical protein
MRDALGCHKIGVSECALWRRKIVQSRMPAERRPVHLVRAVEVKHHAALRIEADAHAILDDYRLTLKWGTEWFSASMRRCNYAVDAALELSELFR